MQGFGQVHVRWSSHAVMWFLPGSCRRARPHKASMSSVRRRRRAGPLSNSPAKSIRVESANTAQDTDTAKIPQAKPPRAKVAQLLGDPVVRGKPFFKLSGKGTHTAGTSIITEATRPVCQAGFMRPLDQVLVLASAAIWSHGSSCSHY